MTIPHSGHLPADARRSYPHAGQHPAFARVLRLTRRQIRTPGGTAVTAHTAHSGTVHAT
ncbi:MAG: hypothetical protein ACAI43_17060 [Phycisphaerae bacterium]